METVKHLIAFCSSEAEAQGLVGALEYFFREGLVSSFGCDPDPGSLQGGFLVSANITSAHEQDLDEKIQVEDHLDRLVLCCHFFMRGMREQKGRVSQG